MTIISSQTNLVDMPAGWWPTSTGVSLSLYNQYSFDYATIYKTQPNVRVCVDFLARNLAQLGLHVYRRKADNDRDRLRDHDLARILDQPLPAQYKVTGYRLIETLMGDMGVYFNAYWMKLRNTDGKLTGLLRIPPELVSVTGAMNPAKYKIYLGTEEKELKPDEIVHFRGYNATSAVLGLSPLETLRQILAEEHASGDYREYFWQNAARMNGIIERPPTSANWSDAARARFKAEFEALYSGSKNSGKTAILEEGMTWKPVSFNPKEAEYLGGRKLTREECARAYHIPLPLVGILDHANFSNITEQHKMLYTDVIGPWAAMIEQEVKLQVKPDLDESGDVYVEFNIAEKMQGDFETQTKSLQSAIGRPWMTANEGRAIMNLSRIEGGDELITPLNVAIGGQASPNDVDPTKQASGEESKAKTEHFNMNNPQLREEYEEKWRRLLVRIFKRQEAAVLPAVKKSMDKKEMLDINLLWDTERWNTEVGKDFFTLSWDTGMAWAWWMAQAMGIGLNELVMRSYIEESARIAAEQMNLSTRMQIESALLEEEPRSALENIFYLALSTRVFYMATGRTTSMSNYGAFSAAYQGKVNTKTWIVNSNNPRHSHSVINGETVPIRSVFSNNLRWPGDYRGGAEENANCQCSVIYNRNR